jgi:hypothetical protein
MSITTIDRSEKTSGVTHRHAANAFAATLRREHERTQAFVGDARRANQRLSASTQQFSDATQKLAGQLAQFRLP